MNPYEDMRIFAQVMEAGSFTAAAERLGMSKQSVSRRLMQLEARLGVRLLNRSTRRLDATPLGQQYYQSAMRLLGEVQQVEHDISGQAQALRGTAPERAIVFRHGAPGLFADRVPAVACAGGCGGGPQ